MSSKFNKRIDRSIKQPLFLRKVNEHKHELFKHDATNTQEIRKRAWMDIWEFSVSIGFISRDKTYKYLRDVTWPNLRNRTTAKVEKFHRTGASSADPRIVFDEWDRLVMEITDRQCPGILESSFSYDMKSYPNCQPVDNVNGDSTCFNGGAQTWYNNQQQEHQQSKNNPVHNEQVRRMSFMASSNPSEGGSSSHFATEIPKRRPTTTSGESDVDEAELRELKKRKLQLELRKLELEVWEKEELLGVAHSHLTSGVAPGNRDGTSNFYANTERKYEVDLTEYDEEAL